jgi:hypothetical protein
MSALMLKSLPPLIPGRLLAFPNPLLLACFFYLYNHVKKVPTHLTIDYKRINDTNAHLYEV